MRIYNKTNYVIVLQNGGYAGIVTVKDVAHALYHKVDLLNTNVKAITSSSLVSRNSGTSVVECLNLMSERGFNQIPLIIDKMIIGIVNIKEVVLSYYDYVTSVTEL